MTASLSDLRISLADVARLAGVQRPVVSVWRSRSAASDRPFPEPVVTVRGQDWFDSASVVEWLEETGRGQDGAVRANVAAHTAGPVDAVEPGDARTFYGLTALLCLSEVSGRRLAGLPRDDLLDLADECDPDDDLLFSEIEALGDRLEQLAAFSDGLADAAFSTAGAFESLMDKRTRLKVPGLFQVALSATALQLGASAALALAGGEVATTLRFVDPTPGGSDLLIAIAAAAEGQEIEARSLPGESRASRLAARRLRVHRLPGLGNDGRRGSWSIPEDAVVVALLPTPDQAAMTDEDVLDAINELAVETSVDNRVLVVAPASALTDRLSSQSARRLRDDLLRTDRLRAIVRLPARLVIGRPRQHLALCCLGPDFGTLPDDRRRVAVGDLSGTALDNRTIDDLATDLVAAMAPDFGTHVHQPAFLRSVPIRTLRAATGSLMPTQPAVRRVADRGDLAAVIRQSLARAGRAVPAADFSAATSPVPGTNAATRVTTLGAAVNAGFARVLPGARMSAVDALPPGNLLVVNPDGLGRATPTGTSVDRLALEAHCPQAGLTEPGDVVFVGGARPRASVDVEGGSVVPMPGRVLRIRPRTGLLPRVVAAEINALDVPPGGWRTWPIRLVPGDQTAPLGAQLAAIAGRRAELTAVLADLDDAERLLVEGVSSGTVAVDQPPEQQEHDH